jgi:hypothetical protein
MVCKVLNIVTVEGCFWFNVFIEKKKFHKPCRQRLFKTEGLSEGGCESTAEQAGMLVGMSP